LFIVPIVGISVSIAGIAVGALGIIVLVFGGRGVRLRLCVAGMLLSTCGLGVSAAIARAPSGYFRPRAVFPAEPETNRPYVPPPAAPRM
jgi:hypothetical protein